ncbi:MAG TPA: histidinol-phosphatase HisJ [Desulfopila sp.]|nr:histidinol-phosphatase HisJ [Desulfopila sp.]
MQLDSRSDYHTHTTFSDGQGSVADMVVSAIEKDLAKIVITDHAPLPFATRYALGIQELEHYRSQIAKMQSAYGDKIFVAMGMEFEFIPDLYSWIDALQRREWDHRIVSIHHLGAGKSLHLVNGNAKEFASLFHSFNNDGKALCTHYYKTLQKGLATGWFDIIGHLDVIKKHNAEFTFFHEDDDWYQDLIYETLELAKVHDMSMEINTGGFNHPPAEQYPSSWIIHAARERNIPLLLSSDSHTPATLGQHFDTFG